MPNARSATASRLLIVLAMMVPASWASGDEVVGTSTGKVYHNNRDCPALKKIAPETRVVFKSIAEAEAEGRRLCRLCQRLTSKPAEPLDRDGHATGSDAGSPGRATSVPAQRETAKDDCKIVRVMRVLPGGTLVLDSGDKISLIGTACPQMSQDVAEESVRFILGQIKTHRVVFDPDHISGKPFERDRLGRMRGYIRQSENKPDLGAELIAHGLGWVDRTANFDRRAEYLEKESDAWQEGRGIWKRLDGEQGRAEVIVGRYAIEYHGWGCGHEDHLSDPTRITLNEAKAKRLPPCDHVFGVGGVVTITLPGATTKPSENRRSARREKE